MLTCFAFGLCFTFGYELLICCCVLHMRTCEFDYDVRHISYNGETYTVSLSTKECSCRRRMLTGLP